MKSYTAVLLALVLASVSTAGRAAGHPAIAVSSLEFGPFGTVTLYQTAPHPRRIVLFASGDGGWKLGVVDMARALATQDALVAGFNTVHYLHALEHGAGPCAYAAADLENLSQYLQKRAGRAHYTQPVLAGYSSGATLVYVALAQAPPNTFRGGLSLGFGPELPVTKPFCRGAGLRSTPGSKHKGYRFIPGRALAAPWAVLQGTIDKVASPAATESFVAKVPGARLIVLQKVGHGYSVPRHWIPQFYAAFQSVAQVPVAPRTATDADLKGLPLVEVPAAKDTGDTLGVVISGDGGWAGIDRQLAEQLAAEGIPVVGLDSLQYFWNRRTPDGAALDQARIQNHN
ncbi:MAG: AcvB/VirJ family lysyl-phosphatidylglycerol hydrolase, partial [Gammaproteobacteria bacterium]